MCGLAGWIWHRESCPGQDVLTAMSDVIAHRGPDGDGQQLIVTRDESHVIGLAHRRLAIIDLEGGVQPMSSPDGRLTLVFNGEIYNFKSLRDELKALGHVFETESDTEVLLQAYREWGTDCVSRFRGMFAFALWDSEQQSLFLARDPFGKKPLYVHQNDRRILFGSEIKCLLACNDMDATLDQQSLRDYLTYRYVPGPDTFFVGIRKLMPGCHALWQSGVWKEQRYFTPSDAEAKPDSVQPEDPVAAFTDALEEAVRLRMVSDVPFGAFLSGGIDSSAVVALMSRHSPHAVKTFSVGFKGADAYSELTHAKTISDQFKTDHTELRVSADDLMDLLPTLIHHRDSPVAEPSDIPIYLISKEASKTVKMVLTGEGSDEILGGYPKHRFENYVGPYQSMVPGFLHSHLCAPLVQALPYKFRRAKTLMANMGLRDRFERMPRWFGALSFNEVEDLLSKPIEPRTPEKYPYDVDAGQAALRKILYFDQTSWLPDNLLERGDRMTMAASIEGRMPFMDHELARFVTTLDDRNRLDGKVQKSVLRKAMARILPEHILKRPKVGFRVPANEWFQTTMRDYLREMLLGPESVTRDYYRRESLERILTSHAEGRQNHEKTIWMLLSLELFQRQFGLR